MADIRSNFLGIQSPNPFWLASAPPTDKEINVTRAFEAGWGGVVWKTLGEDPPVVNVNGPRYSTLMSQDRRVIGLNNIELITDRLGERDLPETFWHYLPLVARTARGSGQLHPAVLAEMMWRARTAWRSGRSSDSGSGRSDPSSAAPQCRLRRHRIGRLGSTRVRRRRRVRCGRVRRRPCTTSDPGSRASRRRAASRTRLARPADRRAHGSRGAR